MNDEELKKPINRLEMEELLLKNYRKSTIPESVKVNETNPFEMVEESKPAEELSSFMFKRKPPK